MFLWSLGKYASTRETPHRESSIEFSRFQVFGMIRSSSILNFRGERGGGGGVASKTKGWSYWSKSTRHTRRWVFCRECGWNRPSHPARISIPLFWRVLTDIWEQATSEPLQACLRLACITGQSSLSMIVGARIGPLAEWSEWRDQQSPISLGFIRLFSLFHIPVELQSTA